MNDLASRPRLLLRRLHQVMAGPGSAQERLDRLTTVIAQNMVAEVCSVYLVRAGEILELFATEGLKQEAVHHTRLRFGEGLVGLVAQRALPLNVQEASSHPRYAYRPETGEETYHSFLGVPIVRHNKVAGILVVQNVKPREYSAEEEEALLTVAMVLAELVGSGELVDPDEIADGLNQSGLPLTIKGQKMADGIALGVAVFHEGRVEVTRFVAEDLETEKARLLEAFETMREQVDRMIALPEIGTAGEHRDILETFKMFAYDRGWQRRIFDAIDSGLTAEASVERVQQQNRRRMIASPDPYLRERLSDLDDLANRLLRTLAGRQNGQELSEDSIIIARTMGPAELLDYDRSKLAGVVLEDGSATSHVVILARAMGIPLIGRCIDIGEHVRAGDRLILDGDSGQVLVRPGEDLCETYRDSILIKREQAAQFRAERNLPSVTRDGVRIHLHMNAGLQSDMAHLDALGADGVGLFRTEFQFMVSSTLPRLETQQELYKAVLDAAGGRPVVFRTLDIGGDKAVPFLQHEEEENPAMGWRAIRIALDRPVLLRYQLRALMGAAAGRSLSIMFPMIADVAEFKAARKIALKEMERFERLGLKGPVDLQIGTMLEVPALAWQLDSLLELVDFVSIGTNDLMQFFFASDRSNPRLIDRYDLLSPAVLSFIRMVVKACDRAGVPVTVCGEMGGRPLEAMALIGLGLRRLSISPMTIGPVRRMIRSLNVRQIENYILDMLQSPDHSLRVKFKDYARDHSVDL
ncbi:phosphoenolpyruvate--protein phosphotransferase [Iodidimonas nitroreducens]|uniref:phosphoenolpyruvate--protein phosphotransferase n=1 Tax=Iodidimonas nitroreducens TaxID=1236968 RepID=A0A5A7NBK2_9PROT|nr:phosphoenolpyruvate--protein phosphotransferase [Iodidimonas nitroreducens]GAK34184.1 phosphoenolpyruvate-protein phosphotransferase PtsP [alpha proteobacterium Q-1]GER05307.1 phosphoenolpyruvate--protein phosphotransferase [Iodidimonas nitroreducens]